MMVLDELVDCLRRIDERLRLAGLADGPRDTNPAEEEDTALRGGAWTALIDGAPGRCAGLSAIRARSAVENV